MSNPLSHLGQMFQDGQISVGLHRKAQSMRQRAKTLVQFHVSIIDRGAAINIKWACQTSAQRIPVAPSSHTLLRRLVFRAPLFTQAKCGVKVAGSTYLVLREVESFDWLIALLRPLMSGHPQAERPA